MALLIWKTPMDLDGLLLLDGKQGSLKAAELQSVFSEFFLPAHFVRIKGNWLAMESANSSKWWKTLFMGGRLDGRVKFQSWNRSQTSAPWGYRGFGSVWPTSPFPFDQERVILTVWTPWAYSLSANHYSRTIRNMLTLTLIRTLTAKMPRCGKTMLRSRG